MYGLMLTMAKQGSEAEVGPDLDGRKSITCFTFVDFGPGLASFGVKKFPTPASSHGGYQLPAKKAPQAVTSTKDTRWSGPHTVADGFIT